MVRSEKEADMNTLYLVIVMIFVFGVLATVGYALFEMSPFARHADHYRDPVTGRRRWESPHLETWDEFEQRTRGGVA
jgi:hypothetical protein